MKLSEKLAALEQAERQATPAPATVGARHRPKGGEAAPAKAKRATSTWDDSKRQVRELVLAEVAPKMEGLTGEALVNEVKSALDKILQREDVRVSPLERRKFVQEMISDTLGYGPLDPLLQDASITEIMCNGHGEIWIERSGRIEPTTMPDIAEGDPDDAH